jgi:hypothetical protein
MSMDKETWITRCAGRYETRAGLHLKQARELAEIALEEDKDGDFSDTPEDAADEDMNCWDDDGEE